MYLSLTRSLSSSEKMMIGSEDSNSVRRSFTKMVSDNRITYKRMKKSSSFIKLLREKKEAIRNSAMDTFLEGGNTYKDFDVPVDRIPGVDVFNHEQLCREGISRVSDLVEVFFNMEGSGTCDSYTNFKDWLAGIGIEDDKDTIATCMSSKWYLMVAKDNHTKKKAGTTSVNSHLVPNVCGILTIGMCSCLMIF